MPMIAIRGLDHVVLRVVDVAAMLRFYRDVLGCRGRAAPGRTSASCSCAPAHR